MDNTKILLTKLNMIINLCYAIVIHILEDIKQMSATKAPKSNILLQNVRKYVCTENQAFYLIGQFIGLCV